MNKATIKNFAIWARQKLISDITYKAGMLGVTEKGVAQPMQQSTSDLQFFDIGTKDYVEISGAEIMQRKALVSAIREKEKTTDYQIAFRSVIEEVAYTWFNRLIAIRFMEVNDYLPAHIRVLSSENQDKLEPDFVTNPFDTDLEFTPYEKDVILQMKEQNKLDELFRMLFIKQCNKLNENLPELFEQISDYTEILLTISFTDKDGVVYHLTHDIDEDDFNVTKEGQVEIIGWLYQYYNTEPKDEVFALLKKNVKITKERIPAATQLFTPDWIVRYMVENSLGRLWVEGHPNDDLKASWKYYLEEAEQEPEVQKQLAKIHEEYAKMNPEDIKVIDPCMGSGHILVYAFDVLMQIYLSYGYTKNDAVKSILEKNLYGIDIDTRAYQLAYFAVMMKARQYSRKILEERVRPNLMAVKNSAQCSESTLKRLGNLAELGEKLIIDYRDAEEYGSILNISYTTEELDAIDKKLDDIDRMADYGTLDVQIESNECIACIEPLIRQARIMGQKYDVVVTNPPYMGASGMSAKLGGFVKKWYPDSKSDMSTVFMEKAVRMVSCHGFVSMINIPVWMFLTSYEKLRKKLLEQIIVQNMVHPGRGIFGSDFGSVSFVFNKTQITRYKGKYRRLFSSQVEVKSPEYREKQFLNSQGEYLAVQDDFSMIPGAPIAYWVSNAVYNAFCSSPSLNSQAPTKMGLTTGDNNLFLKLWYEVPDSKIGVKFYFYNKGGEFRRWYGNISYVINWEHNGAAVRKFKGSTIRNDEYYFRKCISWGLITTSISSFRSTGSYSCVFGDAGPGCFPAPEDFYYTLGFLNSTVTNYFLSIMNPTINLSSGVTALLPYRIDSMRKDKVSKLAEQNESISRQDWDSFETSWNFIRHPMCKGRLLSEAFSIWKELCSERFNNVKENEEEINRAFIDIYALHNELTPKVDDKNISVRLADKERDIKSLISYAVGCMFGRYSLDVSGLVYAGGKWDDSKYRSFRPDLDNCIPITDEEYFKDDIVGRLVEFVRAVYGDETLEENLEFIAEALGNSGRTPRETIRQYFVKDFFKDHCQTYTVTGSGKRPIYWLFDSGKQSGFKALVYMHRWNADTVGNVRVEYLHKIQQIYEKEIASCQDIIDSDVSSREVTLATKRMEKLVKQLKECKDYDAKVAHIALSRIDIDLDDGVKVNYRKVQTGNDGRFCEILADSKDIMVKE